MVSELSGQYDVFIFDCDGVLWRGLEPINKAADLIKKLNSLNKLIIYVTNNSTKTKHTLMENIWKILDVSVKDSMSMYSSGTVTAEVLKKKIKPGEKVYLIGSAGFSKVMDECGIAYIGAGADMDPCVQADFKDFVPDPTVKYVVGAFDPHFNYTKMTKAFIYVKECGAEYLVSNLDTTYPLSTERCLPGTGALLSGLHTALGIVPKVMGKPSSSLYEQICADHKITNHSRVIMVGDNLSTDIQFGINSGIDTCLVLSGVTTKEMAALEGVPTPTFIRDSVADI